MVIDWLKRLTVLMLLALALALALAHPASAQCLWGMGKCDASHQIFSTYVNRENPSVTLRITSSQMVINTGPLQITTDYKVQKATENRVLVEISAPSAGVGNLEMIVADKLLRIPTDNAIFTGDWIRR